MLGTFISLLGVSADLGGLHGLATSVSTGRKLDQALEAIVDIGARVDQLSDDVLIAPKVLSLENTNGPTQIADIQGDAALAALSSTQRFADEKILSSAAINLPDLTVESFRRSPWELLIDIRPATLKTDPRDVSLVPILFDHEGTQYVGWQTRGALPTLFNFRVLDDLKVAGSTRGTKGGDIENKEIQEAAKIPAPTRQQHVKEFKNKSETEAIAWPLEPIGKSSTATAGAFLNFENPVDEPVLISLLRRHSHGRPLLIITYFQSEPLDSITRGKLQQIARHTQNSRTTILINIGPNSRILSRLSFPNYPKAGVIVDGNLTGIHELPKSFETFSRLFELTASS